MRKSYCANITTMNDSHKVFLLLCLFAAIRIALFNIEPIEWERSHQLLRGAEEINQLTFSVEEIELPLFSALIAPFLFFLEPVVAGKIVAGLATFFTLVLSYLVSREIFPNGDFHLWVPILLFLTPVFLFWSLQITSVVVFTALVLWAFYIFYGWRVELVPRLIKEDPPLLNYVFLGAVIGLACLTRYEGFLLLPGFFLYFLVQKRWVEKALFIISWGVVVLPWFVWSKFYAPGAEASFYFQEEIGNQFLNWLNFEIFLFSLLFLFVFPPFFVFAFGGFKTLLKRKRSALTVHWPLFSFIVLETVLFFLWTGAVPRIMIPIMPLLLPFFLRGVFEILGRSDGVVFRTRVFVPWFIASFGLCILFGVLQYFGRIRFPVFSLEQTGLICGLSFVALCSLFIRNVDRGYRFFFVFLAAALASASFVVFGF